MEKIEISGSEFAQAIVVFDEFRIRFYPDKPFDDFVSNVEILLERDEKGRLHFDITCVSDFSKNKKEVD